MSPPTNFVERFKLRVARTVFKREVRTVTEGLSPEELEELASIPGSVAEVLARTHHPSAPVPAARLSPEQRYFYDMELGDYIALIAEVSPSHAEVLQRHPAFAKELMMGIGSILVTKSLTISS